MRIRSDGQRCARKHLEAVLRAPPRDHAGQIAALRTAVQNTVVPPRRLGILLWPARFPVHTTLEDIGAHHRHFAVAFDDRPKSWRALFGAAPSTPVFDPFELSTSRGEFAAQVRVRRFEAVVLGRRGCKQLVAELLVAS